MNTDGARMNTDIVIICVYLWLMNVFVRMVCGGKQIFCHR